MSWRNMFLLGDIGQQIDIDDGAIACDFYHRYPQDVALMRDLGLNAFRFSVAWPRVLPEGRGRVNEAGLCNYCWALLRDDELRLGEAWLNGTGP